MSVFDKLLTPFRRLDQKVAEEIAEKGAIAARAALAEAPLLDALLDGEEIVIVHRIQLKRGGVPWKLPEEK